MSLSNQNCVCCQIAKELTIPPGGIIYADEQVILAHNLDVKIPGYLILFPRRHVEFYHDFSTPECEKIALLMRDCSRILTGLDGVERMYIVSLGEETRHVHFHLFPRYEWMLKKPYWNQSKIDAAELFSQVRKKLQVNRQDMEDDSILEIVNHVKCELIN